MKKLLYFALIFLMILPNIVASQSGREYRRSSIMRGNLVKTVFGNWGVIGQPANKGARGAWVYENNGYIGDVSLLVGAEVNSDDKTFHSVVISPVDRPTTRQELSPTGKWWSWEPVGGYFNENGEGIALYSDPDSWPSQWPDKLTDPNDPGWSGSWNGFFGKETTAAEESFFVMDDNNDDEFNFASNNIWNVDFKPDSTNTSRNGLGLEVKVRGMQWSDFLAQDCIFWLYEITNTGTTDYDKVVFGMLVGTYVGVTSTEDYSEYDDDYSFFDVGKDLTYTGDFDDNARRNPRWTGDVGAVGYAFLESPGNPFDGIDNDGDSKDYPNVPSSAPLFEPEDFLERTVNAGDEIVLIDNQYNRTVVTVPAEETTFNTRGLQITIIPGQTRLSEGNLVLRDGRNEINPNAYDGIDNDLDGLIDENYYLHYRQIRKDQNNNIIFDQLRPVAYIDYFTGAGLDDALIDERRDDGIDNDGDWNPMFDDVGADGVLNTNDFGEGDGVPTLGEPNFDKTDVDESDQIGLTSFEYFTPAREFSMADDEDLWTRLAPGFFKVPESIQNNKPTQGEDGDFIYGSGYFPLPAGATRRISLALVYGEGGGPDVEIDDLLKNRETVQEIYDNDYRFPPAPNRPQLTAVPGDGKVTLHWDRLAEQSYDPVLQTYDFEGYKIYRATDYEFNEVFNITDADGTPIAYEPIAQFDLDNEYEGYFRPGPDLFQQGRGASFFLGENTGLQHTFVDSSVENGRRYFYALVAYDRGDESKDIYPKENDKRIDILPNGEIRTFQNTAVVIPNAPVVGYVPPENSVLLQPTQAPIGTGQIYYTVVDEQSVTGHEYRLTFNDFSNDGIDNNNNWESPRDDVGSDGIADTEDADGTELNGVPDPGEPNLDHLDEEEYIIPITTNYSVQDLTGVTERFVSKDTLYVTLSNENQVPESVKITDMDGNVIPSDRYILNAEFGRIRGAESGDLEYGAAYTITYQYYPVFNSPHIQRNPNADETKDSDNFDGIQIDFNNYWSITLDSTRSGWSNPEKAQSFTIAPFTTQLSPTETITGLRSPSDYRIEFADGIVDSTIDWPEYFLTPAPVNYRIKNVTKNEYLEFIFIDTDRSATITPLDEIVLVEKDYNGNNVFTWDITFNSDEDTTFTYGDGDFLDIITKKPFRNGDVFAFNTEKPDIETSAAEDLLNNVKVYPNPYVAASTHEIPLPPAITTGRGTRQVTFIHLPLDAKVHIFTSRGEHVVTLEQEGSMFDGTVNWDLRTKENLEVAAGVYFYIVESSVGKKEGKLAIIK